MTTGQAGKISANQSVVGRFLVLELRAVSLNKIKNEFNFSKGDFSRGLSSGRASSLKQGTLVGFVPP